MFDRPKHVLRNTRPQFQVHRITITNGLSRSLLLMVVVVVVVITAVAAEKIITRNDIRCDGCNETDFDNIRGGNKHSECLNSSEHFRLIL